MMIKRALMFWFASLFAAAAIAAYDVYVLHHVEPDFGAPAGSFAVDFAIFALFGLVGAICHGAAAASRLRPTVVQTPFSSDLLLASLSAFTFQFLVYVLPPALYNDLRTLLPLLLIIAFGVSTLFFLIAAKLGRRSYGGAA